MVPNRRGQRIAGRFLVERMLGVGGTGGSVWVAHDQHFARHVALKLMPSADAQELARFERGAILAQSLSHANIAKVYEHGRDGELSWIAMELLQGETLASRIAATKTLPAKAAVQIVDQILAGLEHAHAMEIVHRDLKPANLFVTGTPGTHTERLLILDFGIARLVGPSAAERFGPFFPDDDPIAPELEEEVTGEHRICGTPEYMAPEQILGGDPDTRSDLYAVGVLLFRLVSGQIPFRARTRYEVYHRHLHEPPPPLPPLANAPIPFCAALHRAMAKEPGQRFANAAEMRAALRLSVGLPPVKRPRVFSTEFEISAVPQSMEIAVPQTDSGQAMGISPLPAVPGQAGATPPRSGMATRPAPIASAPAASAPVAPASVLTGSRRRGRVLAGAIGAAALIAGLVTYLVLGRSESPAKATTTTGLVEPNAPSLTAPVRF